MTTIHTKDGEIDLSVFQNAALEAQRDRDDAFAMLDERTTVARGLWKALGKPEEWLPLHPWLARDEEPEVAL